MVKLLSEEERIRRTLILCVDSDNDLGVKASVKTPVIGRDDNLKAATSLAISDPEEADANAIFEAVRMYDRLTASAGPKEEYEVATVAGSELGGVAADRKMVSELMEVLKRFPADDVILVTDGYSDETIIPLVQSRVPVVSVRRIVIRHSKSIEESVALFSRYLKLLIEEPKYSKIALGIPGAIMLLICVLWALNLLKYAWVAFLTIFGGILFVKGFRLDELFKGAKTLHAPSLAKYLILFSYSAGILLIGIGCYQAYTFIITYIMPTPPETFSGWIKVLPRLAGWFALRSSIPIITGICVVSFGKTLHWAFKKDHRFLHGAVSIVMLVWSQRLIYEASYLLINPSLSYSGLIESILIGMFLLALSIIIAFTIKKRYSNFFKGEEIES